MHQPLCVQLEPHQNPHHGMTSPSHLTVFTPLSFGSILASHYSAIHQIPNGLTCSCVSQTRLSCETAVGLLITGLCQLTSWPRTPQLWIFYCWKRFAFQRGKIFSSFPGRKQTNVQPWPSFEGSQTKALAISPLFALCRLHSLITIPSTRCIIFWGLVYPMECVIWITYFPLLVTSSNIHMHDNSQPANSCLEIIQHDFTHS